MQITANSALASRLLAWANERFPPIANAVLCAFLYGAALISGRAESEPTAVRLSLHDVLGFLAVYAALLMLRVYDEHKDYALDLQNHPQRVLQRGLITLGHLKVVGALAIAVQLMVSLICDHSGALGASPVGAVTARWLLVFLWSALMAKEFFIGEWLSRRLILYAVSHMVILPMAVLWVVQMGAGQSSLQGSAFLLALVSLLSGFAFEIGRKTRAPEDERPTVDSYTRVLGVRGAVAVLLALSGALGLTLAGLVWRIAHGHGVWVGTVVAALAAMLPLPSLLGFRRSPTAKGAAQLQGVIALQTLLAYGLVAAAWLIDRGVTWR